MATFVPNDDVARVKARIDHPVIDADGHQREFVPLVRQFVRDTGDGSVLAKFDRFWKEPSSRSVQNLRTFWGFPVENSLDRVTSMVPDLLYRRLDEIGIDFALLYPTLGLSAIVNRDDELRPAVCHALNEYNAEVFDGYRDRLEPVATIPTCTPEEAVAELDHAVGELGLKTIVMTGVIPRSVRPNGDEQAWLDTLGTDSLYDYDPVWRRCAELRVAPTFHGLGFGWGTRHSRTSYMYNHIGAFAAAQEAACRSLMLGGVPARFPELRFAFLEGGVAWACQLLADTLGHYSKRNRDAIHVLDPARLDVSATSGLFAEYAQGRMAGMVQEFVAEETAARDAPPEDPARVDEWADARIERPEDIVAVFRDQFFFGCEADDPMNALAFTPSLVPYGIRLNAMVASDIGHWDVPDFQEVVPEAWEQVEDGRMDDDAFRAFTCSNVVRMLTDVNPGFFDDTAVAGAVERFGARRAVGAPTG
jgi:predicted TIM-barrel fold metal-dependent hydrolase